MPWFRATFDRRRWETASYEFEAVDQAAAEREALLLCDKIVLDDLQWQPEEVAEAPMVVEVEDVSYAHPEE